MMNSSVRKDSSKVSSDDLNFAHPRQAASNRDEASTSVERSTPRPFENRTVQRWMRPMRNLTREWDCRAEEGANSLSLLELEPKRFHRDAQCTAFNKFVMCHDSIHF